MCTLDICIFLHLLRCWGGARWGKFSFDPFLFCMWKWFYIQKHCVEWNLIPCDYSCVMCLWVCYIFILTLLVILLLDKVPKLTTEGRRGSLGLTVSDVSVHGGLESRARGSRAGEEGSREQTQRSGPRLHSPLRRTQKCSLPISAQLRWQFSICVTCSFMG